MSSVGPVGGGQQISLQQMTDAITAEAKARGLSDKEIGDLQLSLQKMMDQGSGFITLEDGPQGKGSIDRSGFEGSLGEAGVNLHADIFTFMALFQKFAQEQRQTGRLDREMNMQAQISSLKDAAGQMRIAADKRFTAAIISGSCQIASGAVSIGMSAASVSSMAKQTSLSSQAKELQSFSKDINMGKAQQGEIRAMAQDLNQQATNAGTLGQNLSNIGQGAGGVIGGAGQIAAGSFTHDADLADARKTELEAQAKIYESGKDKANEQMQAMQDIIRDIRDKLSAMEQSSVETNRGISRNI